MGEDTELIAAHTVEQIARRMEFQPEAINQIKTALVEACKRAMNSDRRTAFEARGKQLITQYGCPACHIIPGVEGPRGMIGPSLEDIGARPLIAEKIENTPANLRVRLREPDAISQPS